MKSTEVLTFGRVLGKNESMLHVSSLCLVVLMRQGVWDVLQDDDAVAVCSSQVSSFDSRVWSWLPLNSIWKRRNLVESEIWKLRLEPKKLPWRWFAAHLQPGAQRAQSLSKSDEHRSFQFSISIWQASSDDNLTALVLTWRDIEWFSIENCVQLYSIICVHVYRIFEDILSKEV